jgi:hypothetical protein
MVKVKRESCHLREKWVTIGKVSNVDLVVGPRGIRITCPTNWLIVARWKDGKRTNTKQGSTAEAVWRPVNTPQAEQSTPAVTRALKNPDVELLLFQKNHRVGWGDNHQMNHRQSTVQDLTISGRTHLSMSNIAWRVSSTHNCLRKIKKHNGLPIIF